MRLLGKTRQDLELLLAHKSRAELLDIICLLSSVEQLFKPSEIAARIRLISARLCVIFATGNLGTITVGLRILSRFLRAACSNGSPAGHYSMLGELRQVVLPMTPREMR